eukprot:6191359-Pleurochrysis_carterae.AAC.14
MQDPRPREQLGRRLSTVCDLHDKLATGLAHYRRRAGHSDTKLQCSAMPQTSFTDRGQKETYFYSGTGVLLLSTSDACSI